MCGSSGSSSSSCIACKELCSLILPTPTIEQDEASLRAADLYGSGLGLGCVRSESGLTLNLVAANAACGGLSHLLKLTDKQAAAATLTNKQELHIDPDPTSPHILILKQRSLSRLASQQATTTTTTTRQEKVVRRSNRYSLYISLVADIHLLSHIQLGSLFVRPTLVCSVFSLPVSPLVGRSLSALSSHIVSSRRRSRIQNGKPRPAIVLTLTSLPDSSSPLIVLNTLIIPPVTRLHSSFHRS